MTTIHILAVPSNKAYGFDGVSDSEFELFQQNVTEILNLTTLGYDKEFAPQYRLCGRRLDRY